LKAEERASSCWRCGECCKRLVKGVKVTQQEWEVLEEDINELRLDPMTIQEAKDCLRLPTKGKGESKRCAFLIGKNMCKAYERRPGECKRFPVWAIEGQKMVTFVVSYICPRAESTAVQLKEDLPEWGKQLVKCRPYQVAII